MSERGQCVGSAPRRLFPVHPQQPTSGRMQSFHWYAPIGVKEWREREHFRRDEQNAAMGLARRAARRRSPNSAEALSKTPWREPWILNFQGQKKHAVSEGLTGTPSAIPKLSSPETSVTGRI